MKQNSGRFGVAALVVGAVLAARPAAADICPLVVAEERLGDSLSSAARQKQNAQIPAGTVSPRQDVVQFTCDTRPARPKESFDAGGWFETPAGARSNERMDDGAPVDAAIVTRLGDASQSYYLRTTTRGVTVHELLKEQSAIGGTKVYASDNFRVAIRPVEYRAADGMRVVVLIWHVGNVDFSKADPEHEEAVVETRDGAAFTLCRRYPAKDKKQAP